MEPAMANHGRQTPEEAARARRMRNLALGGALVLLVILFYVMTIVRLGGHALD
jgi:hypothetical protein